MGREKGKACEGEKSESDLGTALRVSERNMIFELAEVLRGEQKKDRGRVSTTPCPSHGIDNHL